MITVDARVFLIRVLDPSSTPARIWNKTSTLICAASVYQRCVAFDTTNIPSSIFPEKICRHILLSFLGGDRRYSRARTEHQCGVPSPSPSSSSPLLTQARVRARLKHADGVQQTERGVFLTAWCWEGGDPLFTWWNAEDLCVCVCVDANVSSLTFSGFRRAQFQVVPRAAVQVEVRGRDPPLLFCRADEPPTCGATQRGWKQALIDVAWRAESSQLGAQGVSVFVETQPMNSELR